MRRATTSAVAFLGMVIAVFCISRPEPEPERTGVFDGTFQLTEVKSLRPFRDQQLRGKAAAIFFGFTHCPEVCPTALSRASAWLKALGSDADGLKFVFITVDPERDTAASMALYLTAFDPRIIGLTGTRAEVQSSIASHGIVALKRETGGGEYAYDHTSTLQLYDARGVFRGTLDFDTEQASALERLRALM